MDLFGKERIKLLEKLLQEEKDRNKELLNRLLIRHEVQPILEKQSIEDEIEKMKSSIFSEVDSAGNEVKVNNDGSIG